jgi:BMFP domain-containing protein YqiC
MKTTKIFDDLAEMLGGAASVLSNVRQQLRDEVRTRVDEVTSRLDLVSRDEFDRLSAMVTKARETQDAILKRLDAIDGKKGAPPASVSPKSSKKSAKSSSASPSKKKASSKK